MAKLFEQLNEHHKKFIGEQQMFFVGTAPLSGEGHINLSPKGVDSFRVLSPNQVAYMDLVGSGNETSAHLLENGRITFMFCAFAGSPNILRIYGTGRAILPQHPEWEAVGSRFILYPSTRQIILADINRVQTSCGYGVPLYELVGQRDHHFKWANTIGVEAVRDFSREHNVSSLDGLPTPLGQQNGV